MAKSRRNRKKKGRAQQPRKPAPSVQKPAPEQLGNLERANGIKSPPTPVGSAPIDQSALDDLLKRANELHVALEEREALLSSREGQWEKDNADVKSGLESVQKEKTRLVELDRELSEREGAITAREEDAKVGFSKLQEEEQKGLEETRKLLQKDIEALEGERARREGALDSELNELRKKEMKRLEEELKLRRQELRDREAEVDRRAGELETRVDEVERLERKLERQGAAYERRMGNLDDEVREVAGERLRAAEADLDVARKEATAQADLARAFREKYEQAERSLQGLNGHTPAALLRDKRELEQRVAELIAQVGSEGAGEALEREKSRNAELEESRKSDRRKIAELQKQLTDARIPVLEREKQQDWNRILEQRNLFLRSEVDQLKREYSDLVASENDKPPFQECSDIAANTAVEPVRENEGPLQLRQFCERLRVAMVHAEDERLYYSAEDVRSFVAGLSMTRLILLEGISGTGKTSLPRAFADVVHGQSERIEVQAGWRDRHDLIGHYNAFEGRFYETDFLRALYRAGRPSERNRVHIILLDEMNLSHPEQYFADFLSALEEPDSKERKITVLHRELKGVPDGFEGTKLPIPPNVWFVGTANHDETTMGFAPKTHDRAHVMELPPPAKFQVERRVTMEPVSFERLEGAFDQAISKHGEEAERKLELLRERFADTLQRRFNIGWGARLSRQFRQYVPVVFEAGGKDWSEPVDRLFAAKVLRKLRNRFDLDARDLEKTLNEIRSEWPIEGQPSMSLELLEKELRKARQSMGSGEDA